MKKLIGFAAVCAIATAVLSAQTHQKNNRNDGDRATASPSALKITPLNVKTGLWQSTTTFAISGGQLGNAARPNTETHKGCLTQQDLRKDPFAAKSMADMKCHEDLIRSTGSDAEVQVSCTDGTNSGAFHIAIHAGDQEHVSGNGQGTATFFGQTMNSNVKFQSRWLQATCPAGAE
jgi:hypothetical protein